MSITMVLRMEWGFLYVTRDVYDHMHELVMLERGVQPCTALEVFADEIEQRDAHCISNELLVSDPSSEALDQGRKYPDGTAAWHKKRAESVTASDVPVILGVSPYLKPSALLDIKLGVAKRKEPWKAAVEYGRKHEPEALRLFQQHTGIELYDEKPGFIQHKALQWLGATPDAICKNEAAVVEVKCGFKANNYETSLDKISPLHYWQIQTQMFVSGLHACYYVRYRPSSLAQTGCMTICRIPFNPTRWEKMAWPSIRKFWNNVVSASVQRALTPAQTVPLSPSEVVRRQVITACRSEIINWYDCELLLPEHPDDLLC